eukprot:8196069-Ditylum_brightwellii.AAC.1
MTNENTAPNNNATSSTEIPGFAEGEYWGENLPQSAPVEEPTNSFQAYAPTVPEEDHEYVPQKVNFDFAMGRKSFTRK